MDTFHDVSSKEEFQEFFYTISHSDTEKIDLGYPESLHALADSYRFTGKPRVAFYLYGMLAKAGHAEAQFQTGLMYLNGNPVGVNLPLFENLLGKASEGGSPQAKKLLATLEAEELQEKEAKRQHTKLQNARKAASELQERQRLEYIRSIENQLIKVEGARTRGQQVYRHPDTDEYYFFHRGRWQRTMNPGATPLDVSVRFHPDRSIAY